MATESTESAGHNAISNLFCILIYSLIYLLLIVITYHWPTAARRKAYETSMNIANRSVPLWGH